MEPRNIRLDLEYDGTNYAGFQIQRDQPTIQGALDAALARLTGQTVRVFGAGRTDAGVHATGQVVNFRTDSRLAVATMAQALNALLPPDIVVRGGAEVDPAFHARFSARQRRYRYSIWNAEYPKAIGRQYLYQWRGPLNVADMAEACQALVGTHDFMSFAGATDPQSVGRSTVREVYECRCWREYEMVLVEIAANAFLPHMVRNIVGTLLQVGIGKLPASAVPIILAARDRRQAGPTAPAQGLCLTQVCY